jgi:hypothetical protein
MKILSKTGKNIALTLFVSAAASQASAIAMTLISAETQKWGLISEPAVLQYGLAKIGGTTATYDFDGTTLTSSGLTSLHYQINPNDANTVLNTALIEDLTMTMGGAAAATSYECVEGAWGSFFYNFNANLCGNWDLGGNRVDESNITYADTSWTRTMGGDDWVYSDPQQLSDYDNTTVNDSSYYAGLVNATGQVAMSTYSWDGEILKIHNMTGGKTTTMTFEVSSVPVPAAAWMFGSALIGLFGLNRKKTSKK